MAKVLQFGSGSETVLIVVDDAEQESSGAQKAGLNETLTDTIERAQVALADSFGLLANTANAFCKGMSQANPRPKGVELSFQLEVTAEGDFKIVKAGAKANFTVKMSYEDKDASPH
jgi:ATP-dependent exoDNAse (exonuclease V) beta subunit